VKVFPPTFVYSLNPETKEVEIPAPRDLFTLKFDCDWSRKKPTAFFRGTATGGGVTIETNQRLHVAQIAYDWSLDTTKNSAYIDAHGKSQLVPYLDAKITGWNYRDKKIASKSMTFVHPEEFPFDGRKKVNFVEIYKQSEFKYLIYVEGHCAACRYGFMMSLGSVILKVESKCVADSMWYFPLLKPYYDHIPIHADYSNLQEVLEWCHSHDKECQEIAANAQRVYQQYISKEGILDYLQCLAVEINSRWVSNKNFNNYEFISRLKDKPLEFKHFPPNDYFCTVDKDSIHRNHLLCSCCRLLLEDKQKKEREEKLK
jgi:hypothetical protein